ncbi:RNAse III [Tepidamorphus gemmatus]|uniref:Ribonuclease 3 n=2 Tax=Tepidamorphus gemmatus TaxID=747076 RepID=A0A4V2UZI6_9HYPH|nr:RNAse III [Tepidamorphus gemmatus]
MADGCALGSAVRRREMTGAAAFAELEAKLGYTFSDGSLLATALTHASAVAGTSRPSYQRLEFLGDHVLGLVMAHMLYERFPDADEGEMSRRLAALVRRETCAAVAREIDLGAFLRLGSGEVQSGGRAKEAILGDVCEAVIGAIYLDGGLDPAATFIRDHWDGRIDRDSRLLKDAKTSLQEWAHARGLAAPVYREVSRSGPDHAPQFEIEVSLPGIDSIRAVGGSKRAAEQNAAEALLVREGVWQEVRR